LDDRPVADEHELRLGEVGLHVDLQRATAVARHSILQHPFGPARNAPALAVEADESRPAVSHRLKRLARDDRLGAGAADPALNSAVLTNERLRAGLGRG